MWALILIGLVSPIWAVDQICCPVVGCFDNAYPFDNMPLPECPEDVQVSMRVYTRSNPEQGQVVTPTTVPPAFDGSLRTIFIVHGFTGSRHNRWMHRMKDAMLIRGNYNVVVTGWSGGSMQIWYPQAASDTQVVGAWMAKVADNLVTHAGATPANMYCTGHSLGSHVCGQMGGRTTGDFGRVTGMDPAGPWFEGRDWSNGLNPSRATRVDAIHTNGEANILMNLGTMKPLADVDFYPNGGGRQPECVLDPLYKVSDDWKNFHTEKYPSQYVDMMPACSHMRVLDLYEESILTPCFNTHKSCTVAWDTPGSCTTHPTVQQTMGFDSDLYNNLGIYYLETAGSFPFCEG